MLRDINSFLGLKCPILGGDIIKPEKHFRWERKRKHFPAQFFCASRAFFLSKKIVLLAQKFCAKNHSLQEKLFLNEKAFKKHHCETFWLQLLLCGPSLLFDLKSTSQIWTETFFQKPFDCLWDQNMSFCASRAKKTRVRRKRFALENVFFCALNENVSRVWWYCFARQARFFSAWGFFFHCFQRHFFALAALIFCAHVFKVLRLGLFLFERVALMFCAQRSAPSAYRHCAS